MRKGGLTGYASMITAFDRAFKTRKFKTALAALFAIGLSNISAFAVQSVTLAWDPSSDPSVTGYNIYYGSASGNYTNQVSFGNVTNATIPALVEGNTYFFVATAFDASGLESDPSNEISYTVPTNATNQPPTLNSLNNLTINENAPQQTVTLSGITSGATNESQTLVVTATSSNPGIIPTPNVSYTSPNATGSLSFTPAVNGFGTSTITVTVNDGQPQNNTVTRSFVVTVNAVNQPPTLNPLSNVTINENASQQIVNLSGISSGATNEIQTLTVTASSSNPGIISNPTVSYISPSATGTLSFSPGVNAFGTSTVTVTVNDGQAQNNTVTRSFVVTVNPVNQPPTFNPLSNITINENDPRQSVNLSGITSGATNEIQTLIVTAASSNPGIIPPPNVIYTSPDATGTLSFAPALNAFGTSTITVSVNDGQAQNNTVTRSFVVTVNPVNQPPTLNSLSNITINENAPQQIVNLSGISSGATNEVQTLSVTASSSNPSVVPTPMVSYTSPNSGGVLSFTPAVNAFGTSTITVSVNDGQSQNNMITRSFIVTVNAVNQPPTLDALADLTINENGGTQTINLCGISCGPANESQTLTVNASSSNPGLVGDLTINYTSPNNNGTLIFTPNTNAFGTAMISVTANDGQASNNIITRTFKLTVNQVNEPPTISFIPNQITTQNTATPPIQFSVTDRETAASNLVVSAHSSNTALISDSNVLLSGTDNLRAVTLNPTSGQIGDADITVSVTDGTATSSTTFRLSVIGITNSIPTVIVQKTGSGTIFPDLNGQTLSAGTTYTLTAIPDPGQVFVGWTGSIVSSSTNLTFVLNSNLTLTANFTPSAYVSASGTYSGLFYEEDQVRQYSAGFFTVSVSTHGTYSGRLQIGAKRYSFASRIDPEGLATNVILRHLQSALQVELTFGRGNQADQMFGRITDGTWVAGLSGIKSSFNTKTNPAPYRGSYTLHVPGSDGEGSLPIGDGFGAVRISAAGLIRLVGTLSDGTKVSQGVPISKNGLWPLYVSVYSGGGSLVSWLSITNQANSDVLGQLSWIKPADVRARYYPSGFTNECNVIGSTYTPPASGTNLVLGFTNAQAVFWGGDDSSSFTNYLAIKSGNRVTNLSSNRLAMTFSIASGTFTGSAMDPDTGKLLPFKGVVLQKQDAGCGFLLGTNRSIRVIISQ